MTFCQTSNIKLPKIGDKTYYSLINEITDNYLYTPYNNLAWDYSQLRPTYIRQEYFTGYKNEIGKINCNLVYHKMEGIIEFYNVDNNNLKLVGIIEKCNFTKSQEITYIVKGLAISFKNEFRVGESYKNKYSLVASLKRSDLNGLIYFLPEKIDSVRFEVLIDEYKVNKDTNTLNLYNLNQKSLLIETTYRSSVKLFVKYSKGNQWFEYNYNVTKLPMDLTRYASRATEKSYDYYTAQYVMPVLSYKVQQKKVEGVKIQDKFNVFNIPVIDDTNKKIIAYPNMVIDNINFSLINYPIGNYRLEISNILGDRIKSVTITSRDNNQLQVDISKLPKGIYLYRFIDGIGEKSATKRFIKSSI